MRSLMQTPVQARRSSTSARTITAAGGTSRTSATSLPSTVDLLVVSSRGPTVSTPVSSGMMASHLPTDTSSLTTELTSPAQFVKVSSPLSTEELIAENQALRNEVENLQKQKQEILDHSIESDMHLMRFTDDVFVANPLPSSFPDGAAAPTAHHRHTQTEMTPALHTSAAGEAAESRGEWDEQLCDLKAAKKRIEVLECELMSLNQPCPSCVILKEESRNMINNIRALEEQLKDSIVPKSSEPSVTLLTQNRFGYFETSDTASDTNTFTLVQRKKTSRSKKGKIKNKTPLPGKADERQSQIKKDLFTKIPFKNISVHGDSHARYLAGLIRDKLHPKVTVSGICKPGAGLMAVAPSPSTSAPAAHCHIVIGGTNDVASGREEVIFKNMETIIKQCTSSSNVVVCTLPHRHDLSPRHPVNMTIRRVNYYITQLCRSHERVELLEFGLIRRPEFTTHGMHLRMHGKRILAQLITEKLAGFAVPMLPHNSGLKSSSLGESAAVELLPPVRHALPAVALGSAGQPSTVRHAPAAKTPPSTGPPPATPEVITLDKSSDAAATSLPVCLPYDTYAQALTQAHKTASTETSPETGPFLG